eukprot:gene18082-21609_t
MTYVYSVATKDWKKGKPNKTARPFLVLGDPSYPIHNAQAFFYLGQIYMVGGHNGNSVNRIVTINTSTLVTRPFLGNPFVAYHPRDNIVASCFDQKEIKTLCRLPTDSCSITSLVYHEDLNRIYYVFDQDSLYYDISSNFWYLVTRPLVNLHFS